MERTAKIKTPDFLSGGGEMGERIRNYDWSKTPLGTPETWNQSLKTSVSICLNSNFPIALYWGKTLTLIYNDAWSPIPGTKHPWALGKPANEVWPDIWKEIEPQFSKAMSGEPGGSNDALLPMQRHGYTEECYFDFTFTPVHGENGKVEGVFNAVIETTYRILNERRSKFLTDLSITLASAHSQAELLKKFLSFVKEADKEISFGLFFSNVHGQQQLIASTHEMPGEPVLKKPLPVDNIHPSQKIIFINDLSDYLHSTPGGFWPEDPKEGVIIPAISPDGTIKDVFLCGLNARQRYNEGYQTFLEAISNIIANNLNIIFSLEEERKRVESLEELDKAKTIFFSNISHEFRTPLTLMLGTIEESLNDPDTIAKNKDRMTVTHRNAMRLLKLVNTLLDFSRIESGRQKANYTLTDISSLTKNLAGNFRAVIEKAGLKFIVKADSIIKPVYIDKPMWEKIVFNLLSNAFKYTLKGSIVVSLFPENNHVVLEVTDTGAGIPEQELPHMFQRFHRIQTVTGRTYEGTGIGLSLIKELIQLHGGSISVKSKESTGSTFRVTIPFGKEHLPAEQTSETIPELEDMITDSYIEEAKALLEYGEEKVNAGIKDPRLSTVLVVDDNADMRQHIQSVLQKQFNVITAANGMEALHKIRGERPSLVLSDIMMPIMDGIQLLKEIKTNKDTAGIPVILLTARAGEESKIEGYDTGADDYLVKPFSVKELVSRIKAQIEISRKRNAVEMELREFLMQAPAAIATLEGRDYVFTLANPLFEKLLGRTRQQLVGHTVKAALPEIEGQGIFELFHAVFTTGKPFVQHAFPATLTIDGETKTRYYDFILQPIRNVNEEVTGIMAHAVEITEQVIAKEKIEEREQLLRQTKEQLELSIGAGKIGVWHWDVKNNVLTWNKEQLEIFGVMKEEFKGNAEDFFSYIIPEDREKINAASRLEFEQSGNQYEFRIKRKDGDIRWIQSRSSTLMDEKGNPEYITGVNIDLTEQVLARKMVEESEKELQALVKEAPVSIVLFEGEDLVARVVNATALQVMGKTEQEILGKRLADYFPDVPERINVYKQVFKTGKPYVGKEVEVRITRYGELYTGYYDLNYTPWFDSSGKIKGVMSVGVEVTEKVLARKKIENVSAELEIKVKERTAELENKNIELEDTQRVLKQKNIELNRSLHELERLFRELQDQKLKDEKKDDFILMASHELKTPVTTIKGYVQLLMEIRTAGKEDVPINSPVFDSTLKTIHKQINKLTSLISELLDLSKIEKGQLELFKTEFDLSDLVRDVVRDTEHTTRHKIELTVDAKDKVYADRDRIMQVLLNIITNAIKYSPGADKIEVKVFSHADKYAAVSVKDQGIGIEKADHEKIFERFYRVEGKREKTFPGFGIGLFIASDIIKRHQGSITVKSEKNKGSEFTFILPVTT